MVRYRLLEKNYNDGHKEYAVQVNPFFGFPLLWFTATYCSLNPPHPDLSVPSFCEITCVFSDISDAQKCLYGFAHKNNRKVIKASIVKTLN